MADRVTVIGWDGSPPGPAASAALAAATLVAGAPRHLALPGVPPGAERVQLGSVARAARRINAHRGTAVVLADGDPGFFGVVRELRDPEHGLEVEVVPAVSAIAAGFARAGMPWDDARVVVANRRTLRRAVNVCRAHPKVGVLTSPGAGPAEIALLLGDVPRTFVICEAIGTDREQVSVLTSDKVSQHRWTDPNIVIVVGAGSGQVTGSGWLAGAELAETARPRGWGLPAWSYGALVEQTPAERYEGPRADSRPPAEPPPALAAGGVGGSRRLRAVQLSVLGPRPGDLLWDVGSGDGSAALEAAALGSAVIAVDRTPAACLRVTDAARRLGLQLQVVQGVAPQVLADLPEPDVIRVGAGGTRVLTACADRRPQRIVTHAVTRDEAESAGRILSGMGYRVECTLLQSVELDPHDWSENSRTVAFLLSGGRV
ncbi:precorrin-6y C5,15-methyltransferase (decarboxylating) subunit CbiE [Streptomyces sp. ACA25]|uniref:precorrin-6y C5,15-methyltransferase (decarboxylating) subunit CbiE n=1 Tax=Streptomyces sp. ACA25 TaxID=3022596 RepID=UPI002307F21C|nr:precorrin-6y C5,15-methyltransferase (decarboxylating) subunit CbiE [Streptomyces sp. ACA25]MDB1088963.1 precorrin-6y C5,15-methyltransferase (decarboxylating) subunit CbiE [Streptomyces sp. ACA25]